MSKPTRGRSRPQSARSSTTWRSSRFRSSSRCHRRDRGGLDPHPGSRPARRAVRRGGEICAERRGLR